MAATWVTLGEPRVRYSAAMAHPAVASQTQTNQRGIYAMLIAMAFFLVNDTLVKLASATLPTGQLVCLRGALACIWLSAMCVHQGSFRRITSLSDKVIWVRGLLDGLASLTYLTALIHLPLANATAINLASPLFILIMAVMFLGESLRLSRTLAALVGFAGVLLVIRPSTEGFNVYAWMCVLGTVIHAARDVITRRIGSEVPVTLATWSNALCVTLLSGVWSLTEPWVPITGLTGLWLVLSSACLAMAYHFIIVAMRHGEMGVIAPFRYSALLYAVVLGYLVWGEIPDAITWIGIGLLVGAGLSLLWSNKK
jgi:drug/metabolite transporter (DMT)-like permease